MGSSRGGVIGRYSQIEGVGGGGVEESGPFAFESGLGFGLGKVISKFPGKQAVGQGGQLQSLTSQIYSHFKLFHKYFSTPQAVLHHGRPL